MKNIVVLPGDGIGPEVTREAIRVLEAVVSRFGRKLEYTFFPVGGQAIDVAGEPLPQITLEACRNSDAILLGAIGGPVYDNLPSELRPESGLLRLRKELELFANLRPVIYYPSLRNCSPLKESVARRTDLIIVRELTGGIYYGKKERSEDGSYASDLCTYSRAEVLRVAGIAFELASQRKGHLTLVDKANVLETSRLWRDTVTELSANYPDVTVEHLLVDHAAMKLVTQPSSFDVILTENLFGDILSDEASVIPGSLGMLPSASIGKGPGLYEPVHGSWPEAAGKEKANPVGAILSAAMMLETGFGWTEEAMCIRHAVRAVIESEIGTADLGWNSPVSTSGVGIRIASGISEEIPQSV